MTKKKRTTNNSIPVSNCKHSKSLLTATNFNKILRNVTVLKCQWCSVIKPLYLCLSCAKLGCADKHGQSHYESTRKHPIAISTDTLTIWCFECDLEVVDSHLHAFVHATSFWALSYADQPSNDDEGDEEEGRDNNGRDRSYDNGGVDDDGGDDDNNGDACGGDEVENNEKNKKVYKMENSVDDPNDKTEVDDNGGKQKNNNKNNKKQSSKKQTKSMEAVVEDATEDSEMMKTQNGGMRERRECKGLRNIGNTCFFNAVLQCLMHTCWLENHVREMDGGELALGGYDNDSRNIGDDDDEENEDGYDDDSRCMIKERVDNVEGITKSFLDLLSNLSTSAINPSIINPSQLFNQVCKSSCNFSGGQQEDSHELLRQLLHAMAEEESKRLKKMVLRCYGVKGTTSLNDKKKKQIKMFSGAVKHGSVDKVFGGHFLNSITCLRCSKPQQNFEPFLDISLPICITPNKNVGNQTAHSVKTSGLSKHQMKKAQKQEKLNKKRAKKQHGRVEKLKAKEDAEVNGGNDDGDNVVVDDGDKEYDNVDEDEDGDKFGEGGDKVGENYDDKADDDDRGNDDESDNERNKFKEEVMANMSSLCVKDGDKLNDGDDNVVDDKNLNNRVVKNEQANDNARNDDANDSANENLSNDVIASRDEIINIPTNHVAVCQVLDNGEDGCDCEDDDDEVNGDGGDMLFDHDDDCGNDKIGGKELNLSEGRERKIAKFLNGKDEKCDEEQKNDVEIKEEEYDMGCFNVKGSIINGMRIDGENISRGGMKDDGDKGGEEETLEMKRFALISLQQHVKQQPFENQAISQHSHENTLQQQNALKLHSSNNDTNTNKGDRISNNNRNNKKKLTKKQHQQPPQHQQQQDNSDDSLKYFLHSFTSPELLTDAYICPNCNRDNKKAADQMKTTALKQLLIHTPPAILTIHLKRFKQTSSRLEKVSKKIVYPELLDLSPFCSSLAHKTNTSGVKYRLYGMVEHQGNMRGGHYTACVRVSKSTTYKQSNSFHCNNVFNTSTQDLNLTCQQDGNTKKDPFISFLSPSSPFINLYLPKRRMLEMMKERYRQLKIKKSLEMPISTLSISHPHKNNTSHEKVLLSTLDNSLSFNPSTEINQLIENKTTNLLPTILNTDSLTNISTLKNVTPIQPTLDPGVWYLADDSRVSRLSDVEAVLKRQAYILFYQRIQ